MKHRILYALWGVLFIVCAGLGFIPQPEGALRWLLTLVSLLFFLPPALLLYRSAKARDCYHLKLIRNLSALSLTLTAALLVANFLTVLAPEAVGNFLHGMLTVVSAPMLCSGHWALSLFCWACLLTSALSELKKFKNPPLK